MNISYFVEKLGYRVYADKPFYASIGCIDEGFYFHAECQEFVDSWLSEESE